MSKYETNVYGLPRAHGGKSILPTPNLHPKPNIEVRREYLWFTEGARG